MNLSKTLTIATLMAAGTLTTTVAVQAQNASNTPPALARPPGGGRLSGPNAERIATQLNLTADQKEKVHAILTERVHRMTDLHKDTTIEKSERAAKMKEIIDDTDNKLKEVLTPDQFAKWQSMSGANRHRAGIATPAPGGATPPSGGDKK